MFKKGDKVKFINHIPEDIGILYKDWIRKYLNEYKTYKIKNIDSDANGWIGNDWVQLEEISEYWFPIELFTCISKSYMKERYNLK